MSSLVVTIIIEKKIRYISIVQFEKEPNFRPLSSLCRYGYSFDYKGQYSIVNLQGETVDMGVAHGDDLQYVFAGIWGSELTMSASDNKFIANVWTPLLTRY